MKEIDDPIKSYILQKGMINILPMKMQNFLIPNYI